MQIVFEGTPSEVLEQIKEYIVRSGYEFHIHDAPKKLENPPIIVTMPAVPDVQIIELPSVVAAPMVTVVKPDGPQKCQYCAKEFKRPKSHVLNCRKNPNRPSARLPLDKKKIIAEYINSRYGVSRK